LRIEQSANQDIPATSFQGTIRFIAMSQEPASDLILSHTILVHILTPQLPSDPF